MDRQFKNTYNKMLIILTAGLGDFIEAIRVLESIRKKYLSAKITLLVSDRFYSYVKNCPYCDEVIPWPVLKGSAFVAGRIPEYIKIAIYLRKQKFDVAINFYEVGSGKGAFLLNLLFKIISPGLSIGRNTNNLANFFDKKVEDDYTMHKSQADYYIEIAKLLGIDTIEKFPNFWFIKNGEISIPEKRTVVGFGIGSDRKTRLWTEEYFADVIKYVRDKYNAYSILLGGKNDKEIAEKILSFSSKEEILDLTGKTDIEDLIKIIAKMTFVISVNSAVMHIAANSKIPTIGLIGPGELDRDRPNGEENKIFLVQKNVGCNPCNHYECPLNNKRCMIEIKPDDVIQLIEKIKIPLNPPLIKGE